MADLLRKADELYVTLPTTTVSSISEAPAELATAVYACDVPAVNALFRNRGSGKGSTEDKKPTRLTRVNFPGIILSSGIKREVVAVSLAHDVDLT